MNHFSLLRGSVLSNKLVSTISSNFLFTSILFKTRIAYSSSSAIPNFHYQELFEKDPSRNIQIEYRCLSNSNQYVKESEFEGKKILKIDGKGLELLAHEGMRDIAHLFRTSHLKQLSNIIADKDASDNDRFVALQLIKNACVSSSMVLPSCQDTGTAIIMGKKGQYVFVNGNSDEEHLSRGVYKTYTDGNLRYSQVAPLTMYGEKNTGTNLPAQIDISSVPGNEYKFLFMAKGGGSANKTYLYQQTKALLNENTLIEFLKNNIKSLGTSACPPYHLAIVIGGTSAETVLKTVKLASARYLDDLYTTGNEYGRAFRDLQLEEKVKNICYELGIGAQFGGKYFVHDVRVIRMPRHGASCPVGIGVSCSADRQAVAKINKDGIFLEKLESDPSRFLPQPSSSDLSETVVKLDIDQPINKLCEELSKYPIKTRLSLTGTMIVARDIAHAKLNDSLSSGKPLPDYFRNHIVYYAGPAKTPEGYSSGSFGPTTAGRMDPYVNVFQKNGGSLVMLAKGNRSKAVTDACKVNGGFYLGSIGGPAAILALNNIKSVEVLDFPELGMEAVWKIKVVDFPAFIVVDDKGNDFFREWSV